MSLRELPTGQTIDRRHLRRLRYVPLVLVVVLGLVAGVVGAAVARHQAAEAARPAPVVAETPEPGSVADVCRPTVEPPVREPWLEGDPAAAEAVWNAHPDEVNAGIIQGKDGWIDWGDFQASNFSQVIGRRTLTVAEADAWNAYLGGLRDALAERGVPFYIVITPAKFAVYPEELPDWAQEIRGSGPLDQLIAGYPDLPIVDLRADLRAAAAEADDAYGVYSRVNSHWTDYGAYVGWQRVAACIAATDPELGDLSGPAIEGVDVVASSNEWRDYGIADPAPDSSVPVYSSPLRPVELTDDAGVTRVVAGDQPTGLLDLPLSTTTEGASTRDSALVLRDSFGSALSIPLQQVFEHTRQVRHNLDFGPGSQPDVLALVDEYRPDVVIYQIAARHLIYPPSG